MKYPGRIITDTFHGLQDPLFAPMSIADRWQHLRRRLWERDGGLCGICGQPVDLGPKMHLDHIVQVGEGGSDDWQNLRITHAKCNQSRPRTQLGEVKRAQKPYVPTRPPKTVNKLVRLLPEEAETLHRAAELAGLSDTQMLRLLARQAMLLTFNVTPILDALEAAKRESAT
jgi:hypothetical protein